MPRVNVIERGKESHKSLERNQMANLTFIQINAVEMCSDGEWLLWQLLFNATHVSCSDTKTRQDFNFEIRNDF